MGGVRRRGAAIAAAISVAALTAGSAEAAIDVQIVNQTGRPDRSVYVMLSGGSSSDGRLRDNTPVRLSDIGGRRFPLTTISAGRIFFSFGSSVNNAEPPAARIRYDKVELTYPGVANLTAVDFFAIPFRLQTLNARGRVQRTLGYSAPTNTIVKALLRIRGASRALIKTAGGQFARVLSPQLSPTSFPSFRPYVDSLAGRRVVVRGAFFGTPFQTFTYAGTFTSNGSITLTGTIAPSGGRPAPGQALSVAGPALAPAVYTVDGPYEWGGAVHHVSDNDVYAVIYRDLIAGFAWGYWDGRYGNDTDDWTGKPPFAAARPGPARYATYNEYAAVIYRYSNAYGFSFSDTGPKQVQIALSAPTLRITILPDQSSRR